MNRRIEKKLKRTNVAGYLTDLYEIESYKIDFRVEQLETYFTTFIDDEGCWVIYSNGSYISLSFDFLREFKLNKFEFNNLRGLIIKHNVQRSEKFITKFGVTTRKLSHIDLCEITNKSEIMSLAGLF